MKGVIFVAGDYPIGSSALRVRLLHEGLAANGVDTNVFLTFPAPSKKDVELSEDYVTFAFEPKVDDKNTHSKIKRGFSSVWGKLSGARKGYKFLKKHRNEIDFVFSGVGLFHAWYAYRFCKKYGKQFFIERNDENRRKYDEKKNLISRLSSLEDEWFDKYVLPKADCLFVVSSYLEDKYKAKFPQLNIVRSTPSLLNYSEFKRYSENNIADLQKPETAVLANGKVTLMFAGSCIYTNGLKFSLDNAAALIKEHGYDCNIVWVIFKGYVAEMKAYAAELGIADHFTIIENVQFQYIPALYTYADILIFPEMGDVVANAGFPGKTAEYLASGKAICATQFSNITDVLVHGENAMIAPVGDAAKYRENLKALLDDPALRQKLGANGLQTALNEFDYKNGVLNIVQQLRK